MYRILFPVMVSVRQWELLERYGPWFTLILSVGMILEIMFFIFFRCNEIFAMGLTYDCAVGKGWYGVMGIFAITATVSLLMLFRGKRGDDAHR